MPQAISVVILLSFCFFTVSPCLAVPVPKKENLLQLAPQVPWQEKAKGLDFAEIPLDFYGGINKGKLRIARYNPQFFDFSLHSKGQDKTYPKTLLQWAKEGNLTGAINASMYLPDGQTSTGYMRNGEYINNANRAKKFGAYFLAKPKLSDLASARIVEKNHPDLEKLLEQYAVVIQNYRLISAKRNILWSKGGQKHSISAVGVDNTGNILFLHCANPLDAYTFAEFILKLPINISTVMYVEGGVQAGMVLRVKNEALFFGGKHPAEFFLGNVGVALPNVLGVSQKDRSVSQ